MKTKVLLLNFMPVFLALWSVVAEAQNHKLPPPEMTTSGSSPGVPPPPPGLPIDFGIPGVMAGGLLIGIYFLRNRSNRNVTGPTR